MPPDFALAPSPTTPGKQTLAVGPDGDFYLDDSAAYPVLAALYAHKNEWRWAPTYGTKFHTIKSERRTQTTSQLQAAGADALAQARAATPPWISPTDPGSVVAVRDPLTGRWSLTLGWTTSSGGTTQRVDF